MTCKHCGGPCPESKNPDRPRVFCRNACRAQWRVQERNREIQAARDALQVMDDDLAAMRRALQVRIDALDALIVHPRNRTRRRS